MSVHPSLKQGAGGVSNRSVFTRWERIEHLKAAGKWEEDRSVLGLPKVRTPRIKKKKK